MLRKIIFLLLGLTLGLSLQTRAQDRNALWIHGYNGDESTWRDFSFKTSGLNAFISLPPGYTGYKLSSYRPWTYDTESGANSFISQIIDRNPGVFQNNMITVAHSFGGVAARHMDRTDATHKLGGIITVGSPLNGAGIASSINSRAFTLFCEDAVLQLSRGLKSTLSIVGAPYIVLGVGAAEIIADILAIVKTSPTQSTQEMAIGSNFITDDINASPTSTPKVSIYGNEVSPVHWNFLKSTTGINFPTIMTVWDDASLAAFVIYGTIGMIELFVNFLNPSAYLNLWRSYEWLAGHFWIEDSERMWNVLIGSNIPAPVQCNTYTGFVCSYSNNANFMNPSCWQTVTSCYGPQMLGKSDGFIPCSSQIGLGSNSWAGVPTIEAFNVNHSNEHDVNNAEMQSKFAAIFNGTYGDYFKTDPR